ncbi:MAG: membrane protein insertase YidC [Kineosporiaceae bacterium]
MLSALFDPALTPLHTGVGALAEALDPVIGDLAVPLALVLLTVVVRLVLAPLALRAARARKAVAALGPGLQRLRRRHASDPARLARESRDLHRSAGVSPLSPVLPLLAQVPVLLLVYRLCTTPVVGGAPNAVLAGNLLGAPLAERGLALVTVTGGWPAVIVVVLVACLTLVAWASSARAVRLLRRETTAPVPPVSVLVARVAPFATVIAVAVVPLAVSVYLLASTTWSLAEQAAITRIIG